MESEFQFVFPDQRDVRLNSTGANLDKLKPSPGLSKTLSRSAFIDSIDLNLKTIDSLLSAKEVEGVIDKKVKEIIQQLRNDVETLKLAAPEEVKQLTQRIEVLQDKLTKTREQRKTLGEKLDLKETEIGVLTNNLEESNKKVESLELDVEREREQYDEIKKKYEEFVSKSGKDSEEEASKDVEDALKKLEETRKRVIEESKTISETVEDHAVGDFIDVVKSWDLYDGETMDWPTKGTTNGEFKLSDLGKFSPVRYFEDADPKTSIRDDFLAKLITDAESLAKVNPDETVKRLLKAYRAYEITSEYWIFSLTVENKPKFAGKPTHTKATDAWGEDRYLHNELLALVWIHFGLHKKEEILSDFDFKLRWKVTSSKTAFSSVENVLSFYNNKIFTKDFFTPKFTDYISKKEWPA